MVYLYQNERIDQLKHHGVQIIQSTDVFRFSIDAVLLANFPNIPKRGKIIDLCAGNGAVGLLASEKTKASITGVEIQPRLAEMGRRSIQLNHLNKQLDMITLDLKIAHNYIKPDSVDLILCNPPYFKELPTSQKNPNQHLAIARHEIHTNLNEVITTSAKLLKMNGHFAMVHRPERLLEILHVMEQGRIIPKRIQFVYPKFGKEANILLIEGIKDGKTDGLKILSPLYVYQSNGQYTPEITQMLYGN